MQDRRISCEMNCDCTVAQATCKVDRRYINQSMLTNDSPFIAAQCSLSPLECTYTYPLLDGVDTHKVGVPRLEAIRAALNYDHIVAHLAQPFALGICQRDRQHFIEVGQ